MHSLTNVPTAASGLEIKGRVDGNDISVVCAKRHAPENDYLRMTSTFVGDHMLGKPDDLRQMYARDLATAIRMGRDAGYEQAKAEIRRVLGVDSRR